MRYTTILLTFLISFSMLGQEKERVRVVKYNQKYALLTLNTGEKLKLIQEINENGTHVMNSKQYNMYKTNDKRNIKYYHKKTLRTRPVKISDSLRKVLLSKGKTNSDIKSIELDNFINNNISLEYWVNKDGDHLILRQKMNWRTKFKKR